ncbi:hypothetical protein WDU94_010712 [Cyamophila willieti]
MNIGFKLLFVTLLIATVLLMEVDCGKKNKKEIKPKKGKENRLKEKQFDYNEGTKIKQQRKMKEKTNKKTVSGEPIPKAAKLKKIAGAKVVLEPISSTEKIIEQIVQEELIIEEEPEESLVEIEEASSVTEEDSVAEEQEGIEENLILEEEEEPVNETVADEVIETEEETVPIRPSKTVKQEKKKATLKKQKSTKSKRKTEL